MDSQLPHVRVTVLEAPACHHCADAKEALQQLSASFRFTVDVIDVRSSVGQALAAEHRAAMSPLVLVNGRFFSHGRLPRRKLEKLLREASAALPTNSDVVGIG